MYFQWVKKAPGHYATDCGEWEVRRDGERYNAYVIYRRNIEQSASKTAKGAMLKAGKMFATITEARSASIVDTRGKVIGQVT